MGGRGQPFKMSTVRHQNTGRKITVMICVNNLKRENEIPTERGQKSVQKVNKNNSWHALFVVLKNRDDFPPSRE